MSLRTFNHDELLTSTVNRYLRLYSRDEVGGKIIDFIKDNYMPKLPENRDSAATFPQEIITEIVCSHFSLTASEIMQKTKRRNIVYPRKILQYFLLTYTNISSTELGKMFGQDHSTVIHSRQRVLGLVQKKPAVKVDVLAILNRLPKEATK